MYYGIISTSFYTQTYDIIRVDYHYINSFTAIMLRLMANIATNRITFMYLKQRGNVYIYFDTP